MQPPGGSGKGRGVTKQKAPEPIGTVARRLRILKPAAAALTEAQHRLANTSVSIFGETATARDAAFIARELVQASLPHSNPGDKPLWTRHNGNVTLAIQPGMNIQQLCLKYPDFCQYLLSFPENAQALAELQP